MNKPKKKSYMNLMHEYLISEGAVELTDEDRKTEWYKKEIAAIKNISCRFESKKQLKILLDCQK